MQDMKLTDQCARHEIAGHENAGHEIAGHEISGHENAGHENAGHEITGHANAKQTRKLCYRKDDRAMRGLRPIHGCPENFRESLTTPTATIPNVFHGLLFGSTL